MQGYFFSMFHGEKTDSNWWSSPESQARGKLRSPPYSLTTAREQRIDDKGWWPEGLSAEDGTPNSHRLAYSRSVSVIP